MIGYSFEIPILHVDGDGLCSPASALIEMDGDTSKWTHNGEELAFRRLTAVQGWGKLDGPAVVLGVEGLPWEMAVPAANWRFAS